MCAGGYLLDICSMKMDYCHLVMRDYCWMTNGRVDWLHTIHVAVRWSSGMKTCVAIRRHVCPTELQL